MLEGVKKAHLIGIGGIGMSAVAKLLVHRGISVTGSDMYASDITRDLESRGIRVSIGHNAAQVEEDVDLVIYSEAVPDTNPERGKKPEMTYAEFLGELSQHYETIVVTGTNGKSTTTAMLGQMLIDAGMDPTVIVGTLVPGFSDGNLQIGLSTILVLEGCEYRGNMLQLNPTHIVLTNIEEDHLDFYRDIDHIHETFQTFVSRATGKVIWNEEDVQSKKLAIKDGVSYQHEPIELPLPGRYNQMNAMAALTMARELGVSEEDARASLEKFTGVWRRFETVGEFKDAIIISDYGHHPTAVEDVLIATREKYPNRRIVLCFQPHQHSRTLELKEEFVEALSKHPADVTIIPEIYGVVGRTEKEADEISSEDLVTDILAMHPEQKVMYTKDLETAEQQLREIIEPGDLVLIMGAGDVDMIARNLV